MLVGLGGLFAFVLIYQFFLGGAAPKSTTRRTANANAAATAAAPGSPPQTGSGGQAARPRSTRQADEVVAMMMADLTPLDLPGRSSNGQVEPDKERGPIFAYYVPPPPLPPKPPDPPPITLTGVSPASAVAGTPRKITLTIVANTIPADAQLFFDSAPRQFRRLNDHQLATDLEAAEYTSQRSIQITLKSASDPKMYSGPATFSVQPGPEPQFRYVGRLGEQALFELPTGPNKEIKRFGRGDVIMGQWRIDAITDQGIDLTHTQYEYKRRVPLSEKTR